MNKFLLFKYNYIKEVSYINIGDYIQTFATKSVVTSLYHSTKFKYFDRDTLEFYDKDPVICVMQGWFSHTLSFMPSPKVLPVFVGTHFTHSAQQYLKSSSLFSHRFSKVEIGCRDLTTLNFCKQHSINSYFSRCLTLPRCNIIKQHKVFLVDVPSEFLPFLPNEIRNNAETISHYKRRNYYILNLLAWKSYLKDAEVLLKKYSEEGDLVITSRLHCALPCIAMGIKVILLINSDEQKTRFSACAGILKPYTIDDFKEVRVCYDFVPPPNIEELKGYIIENLRLSISKLKGDQINEERIRMIRENIERFSS